MNRVQHKLIRVMKEITDLMRTNPNNSPKFDVLISHGNMLIGPIGPFGRKMAQIIDQNGF